MVKKKSLADYALEVLQANGAPMSARDMVEPMKQAGWVPGATKPEHHIYTTLFGRCGRHKEASEFRFLGNGTFTTAEVAGSSEELVVVQPKTSIVSRPRGSRTELPVVSNIPLENRKCGNCDALEFTGIQEFYQKQGVCERWEQSGRLSTYVKSLMCPYWRPISENAVRNRKIIQNRARTKIATFNILCSKGLGWVKEKSTPRNNAERIAARRVK